jgi:hypothetical protein
MPESSTKAFVSYNHADKEIAVKIATVLKAHGIEVWFDEWKIVLSDSIEEEISKGLQATHFVFLISKNTDNSRYQKREFLSSLSNFINSGTPKIIPILLDDAMTPELIKDIKHHHYEGGTKNDWDNIIGSITGKLPDISLAKAVINLYKETVLVDEKDADSGQWYPFPYKLCPSCGSSELSGSSFFYDENVIIEIKCKNCGWSDWTE